MAIEQDVGDTAVESTNTMVTDDGVQASGIQKADDIHVAHNSGLAEALSASRGIAGDGVNTTPVNGYDVPSRRLSLLVEGRDYLKYRETFERLLFSEKMTPAQKDARILKLAMACLTEKMDAVSVATGEPFMRAEMLAG